MYEINMFGRGMRNYWSILRLYEDISIGINKSRIETLHLSVLFPKRNSWRRTLFNICFCSMLLL